jgi:hypothetical protein
MDSKTITEIRISADEIKKRFKIEGQIIAFCTPTKQGKCDAKDKCLLLKIVKKTKEVVN